MDRFSSFMRPRRVCHHDPVRSVARQRWRFGANCVRLPNHLEPSEQAVDPASAVHVGEQFAELRLTGRLGGRTNLRIPESKFAETPAWGCGIRTSAS